MCITNYKIKNQVELLNTFKCAAENNRFMMEKFYKKLFYEKNIFLGESF